jgi:hypothetical protein
MTATSERLDHFHLALSDDPYWTESSWFSWAIPERGINGLFYIHFRPNMNCVNAGPAMWDASGEHVWDFLYFDWQLMRVPPVGTYGVDYDKYDFETPWGMATRVLEPLKRYQLRYQRNEFELDLVFQAVAEPNVMGENTTTGLQDSFRLHFEQPGRIAGTVKLDGERFDINCFSIRDGSHGRRFLESGTPGGYTWSTANDRTGWHLIAHDTDRSPNTRIWGGYLLREGIMAPLVQGVRRVVERERARPSVIEVEAEDSLGRQLHAAGRAQTPAEFMLFPDRGQWWTLFQWDYDGFTGAVGEDQEYYGIHDFRRWHRAGAEAWRSR